MEEDKTHEKVQAYRSSITFYLNSYGDIEVTYDCFQGNISDFEKEMQETYGESLFFKECVIAIQLAKLHIRKNA